MKKRSFFSVLIILVLVFALVGCNTSSKGNNNGDDNVIVDDNDNNINDDNSETTTLVVYFANNEYIETGDESLDKLVAVDIKADADSDFANVIIETLQNNPEDDSLSTLIRDDITILDARIEDNTAIIDFSSENLNGGSLEEIFIIDQIVASFLELDEVKQVQFLVDGEKAESLMGHIMIEEPITGIN